jgi:hypothetical protein
MSIKNYVLPTGLTNIASSTVTGTYAAVNSSGFAEPLIILRVVNGSTTAVTISYDGTNDHDYLPSGDTLTLNFQANAQPSNWTAQMRSGTVIWVKGTAGTGNIYVAGYWQPSS